MKQGKTYEATIFERRAAMQYLSNDMQEDFNDAVEMLLYGDQDDDIPDGVTVWQAFEYTSRTDLVEYITNDAESLQDWYKEIRKEALQEADEYCVKLALADEFPLDVSTLHLINLA